MEKDLQIGQKVEFAGTEITEVLGGFSEGKRGVLAREVAEIHEINLSRVNQNINRNRKRFKDGVDIVDIKRITQSDVFLEGGLFTKAQFGNSRNIYLLSERGYAKLIKIMDDDKSWEVHDKLVDDYFDLQVDNKRLATDNTELHKIAVSDDEQKERQYQADKVRYGWQNIRTVLGSCDYKTIEDEAQKIMSFHTEDLKKRDRANYDSHKEANKTEYKQIVRDRVYSVLNDIYNTTLDGSLRAITGDVKENVIKDKIGTINRSNGRIQSNLEREIEANREPAIDEYHTINFHPLSENSMYQSVVGFDGKAHFKKTRVFEDWIDKFKRQTFEMPKTKDMGLDTSKQMKIYLAYDHLDKFDSNNFKKSIIDIIADHYRFNDKLIVERHDVSNKIVGSYDEGKMYFYLENIEDVEVAV